MIDKLKPYLDLILSETDWSWTVAGILYLITATTIRGWFIDPLVRAAKASNRHLYRETKAAYLKNCLPGWFFFLLPLLIVTAIWYRKDLFPLTVQDAAILLGVVSSFVLSILLHMQAFAAAAITTLHKAIEKLTGRDI